MKILEEDVLFEEGLWGVVHGLDDNFFSRHDECNGADKGGVFDNTWMRWEERICSNCFEVIPDNIQTLVTLLMWGS